jgi:general L-amino acid transport system substrate-binding protein
MRKRYLLLLLVVITVLPLTALLVRGQDQKVEVGPITKRVMDRGELICGAHGSLAGFGTVSESGEWTGFDVDICHAIAAAVLGDATKVTFRKLSAEQRQAAIQSEEVDVMSRNTTWTFSRDTTWGATFAPTTFYDGQGIIVTAESGITDITQLKGATICVQTGTTTELNLADAMKSRGLDYTPKVFADADSTWQAYLQGTCDAFTTDKSGLVSYKATAPDPGAHVILDITLSKEPLGPLTPQSDPQWADIVRWTVYGLIQAEEFGITSKNIDDMTKSDLPDIQRFLGQGDNPGGTLLGLKKDWMVDVIRQVGNYGEIYDRNLGPDTPFKLGRGINDLWTKGGLMYAPPFR